MKKFRNVEHKKLLLQLLANFYSVIVQIHLRILLAVGLCLFNIFYHLDLALVLIFL